MLPGTSPTLFDTLATTGAKPNANSVGKVISEPDPTTALMAPAAVAAARIAMTSAPVTGSPASERGGRVGEPASGPALHDQPEAEAPGEVLLREDVVDRAGR